MSAETNDVPVSLSSPVAESANFPLSFTSNLSMYESSLGSFTFQEPPEYEALASVKFISSFAFLYILKPPFAIPSSSVTEP